MRYYPVYLDIREKPCTVIGGGEVAARKADGLLKAGAIIRVISPRVTKGLRELVEKGRVEHVKRAYRSGDLQGASLVFCASSSKEANRKAYEEARLNGIPVNVVDDPAHCAFIVPSIIERGDLTIAISTAGRAPYLAKNLRLKIEGIIGPEYGAFTGIIGEVRAYLLKKGVERVKKERIIKALVDSPMLEWIERNDEARISALLTKLLGKKAFFDLPVIKFKKGRGKRKNS